MKTKKGVVVGILFAFIILVSFYFDSNIVWVVSLMRNDFFNDFFLGLTFLSSGIIIFFFLTIIFLWKEKNRKWILPLWFTLVLYSLINFLLKFSIQRPRPFQLGIVSILPVLEEVSYSVWNFSFPSGHAMLVFSVLPFISKRFPNFKYVWIVFAVLVAFSRVYFGLHFLSDVIAGGLIGYLLGVLIINIEKDNKFWEKIYKKVFGKK